MICYQQNNLEQEQRTRKHRKSTSKDQTLSDLVWDQRYWISIWPGQEYILYSLCFKVKVLTLTSSPASLCSCPVLWKYIPIFIFVSEFSLRVPCVPTFLSSSLSFLMTLRCPGLGMSCNSRDCEQRVSRNIWQYLNNNKAASAGQPEHEVSFYLRRHSQVRTGSFNFRDCVRKEWSQLLLSRR